MSHRLVALIGICTWLVSWGAIPAANAAEQLVVPFTCHAHAGGVAARPSQLQNYAIIGGREAAPFTACASDGSDRCRTMMLHRFEIDCAGTRVGWPEFYAAISDATTGRAYMDNNRLLVRVPPQRNRRSARSRFRPPPSRRAFLVEMPDGYAPVRGTVARFEGQRIARKAPPMQATRDPFSSPPQRPVAPVKQAPRLAQREKPKTAIAQPKPADKTTTKRNVIVVPNKGAPVKTQNDMPTVTKRPVARPAPAKRETKVVSKPKAPPPVKPASKLKIVEIPPVKQPAKQPVQTPLSTDAIKAEKIATPSVVPKLLNGPKENKAIAAEKKPSPSKKDKSQSADQPRTIVDLLQNRGEKIRANAKSAPSQDLKSQSGATQPSTGSASTATAVREQPSSPSLANTLAVLGVVAGLMLALSLAAFRLLAPNPTPTSKPALAPRARLTKSEITETPSLALKEPTLAAPTLADTAQASVALSKKPDEQLKTDAPKPQSRPQVQSQPVALAAPKSRPPTAKDAAGQHAQPSLQIPATPASDFISPEIAVSSSRPKPTSTDKPQPELSLKPMPLTGGFQSSKPQPELPMPKLVADKIKQPDFDESALLLPKTRQEALSALGVAESAGEDVIERVVAGLRQCWRPDASNDKAERKRRLQRMQQIETAWRILSDPPSAPSEHAKHLPN